MVENTKGELFKKNIEEALLNLIGGEIWEAVETKPSFFGGEVSICVLRKKATEPKKDSRTPIDQNI